jgi:hypothetical protein
MKVTEGNEVKEALNEFDEFVASVLRSTDSENIPPEADLHNITTMPSKGTEAKKTKQTKRAATTVTKKKTGATSGGKTVRATRRKKTETVYESEEDEDEEDEEEEDGDAEEDGREEEEEENKGKGKTTRRQREVLQSRSRK